VLSFAPPMASFTFDVWHERGSTMELEVIDEFATGDRAIAAKTTA